MAISIAQAQLFFLALTRMLAMLIHMPMLGGRLVPTPVRLGLGLLLTAVLIPWAPLGPEAAPQPPVVFGLAAGREIVVGTLIGFAAAMVFATLQVAGEVMGQGSGFSAAQYLNPALDMSGTAYDSLFVMAAMLVFLVIDGHHVFLLAVGRTYQVLPLGGPLPLDSVDRLLRMTSDLILAGVEMALPVLGTMLLTDLALGLLARAAPQVSVFFLGLPLKFGVALLGLALAFPALVPPLTGLFKSLGSRMLQLVGG